MSLCHKDPSSVDVTQPIFDSGLVGTGLLPAMQQFVLRVKELCRERLVDINAAAQAGGTEPGALDSTPLPRRVLRHDGSSFDIVNQLAKGYLPAGLQALSDETLTQATERIQASMSVDVLAVVISCGALVGFYVLLYAPLVARLDNEIKRTRFLLLLFPEEVAKGEPSDR
jgi:hypothetical protein